MAYATYTVVCPHCGSTTTVNTGIKSSGTGVGSCGACRKLVRVEVDSLGNIKRIKITRGNKNEENTVLFIWDSV